MKKILFLIITATLCLTSSCETSDNGELDGMWHITRIDSISNGTSHDIRTEIKFWSFQGKILQFFNYREDSIKEIYMARFKNKGSQLIISNPFIYNRMTGDYPLSADSLFILKSHGINSVPDTFAVEHLDRKKMQLADDVVRLYFEKY